MTLAEEFILIFEEKINVGLQMPFLFIFEEGY
jgi:hypothetical protein